MDRSRLLNIAGMALLALVAVILCFRQIGEPDVWWQIRTGQYILENGYVPLQDVFSYTYEDAEWINVKWLTEVLMAFISNTAGPEFIPLLQAVAILLILLLLFKSIVEVKGVLGRNPQISPGILVVLLVFLLGMAFRLNARPEIMSYLFTAVFIYLLVRFRSRQDKSVFLLIPAQLLWANMHEAYGVGIVMLLLFVATAWVQYYLSAPQGRNQVQKLYLRLTLAAALAILVCGIHPGGVQMILHPFEIFGQLQENKFTTELLDYRNREFWQLPAFVMLLMLAASVTFIFRSLRLKIWHQGGAGLLVIFAAFLYLSFQAQRNIPFFLLIAVPFAALWADQLVPKATAARIAVVAVLVLSYVWIGSGGFYSVFLPREKYGLRVDPTRHPIGAARFIEEHGIEGHAFVDYFNSSFFLWYLAPDFKTYIDLRDLDIFESTFMQNVFRAYVNPQTPTRMGKGLWQVMDEADNFNYIAMINREEFVNFHQHINALENWEVVYVDLNLTLYLKTTDENLPVISQNKGDSWESRFRPYRSMETPGAAVLVSRLFWPAYEETDYRRLDYLEGKKKLERFFN